MSGNPVTEDQYETNNDWLCVCGHYEEGGCCCTKCGGEAPWGCVGCAAGDERAEEAAEREAYETGEAYWEFPL